MPALCSEEGVLKRGTPDHPKTHTLAAILNVPQYAAVGVLESLWHFAQQYAQAGDVGRYTDEAIARAIGWDGNAATLVSAMVQAGWLDRCHCHRARVHDWPQHADQTVKRWLAEHNQRFLVCYDDASTILAPSYPAVPCRAVAVPCQAVADAEPLPVGGGEEPRLPERRPDVVVEDAIRKARWDEERELLRAVGEIARRTGRDPPAVMRQVTAFKARDGTVVSGKANPAQLASAERVSKSLEDAKAWLADLEAKGETGRTGTA